MNLAFLHAGALGDCTLSMHLARRLRDAGHHVTVFARSSIALWAARRNLIDRAFPLDRISSLLWLDAAMGHSDPEPPSTEALDSFDRVISFLGGPDEPLSKRLASFCGAERIISIDPKPNEQTLHEGTHITQQWTGEIRGPNIDLDFSNLKYEISDSNRIKAPPDRSPASLNFSDFYSGTLPDYQITKLPNLIVHPGSGGRDKCCPLEALERLMHKLLAEGWNARWMIGPDEVERDGPEFRRRLERAAPVIFEESLSAAADLVAGADAFIGNDAGMTHVAALAGVLTVAIFGPTDPRVWRPLGRRSTVVSFPEHCTDQCWFDSIVRIMDQDVRSWQPGKS